MKAHEKVPMKDDPFKKFVVLARTHAGKAAKGLADTVEAVQRRAALEEVASKADEAEGDRTGTTKTLAVIACCGSLDDLTLFVPLLVGFGVATYIAPNAKGKILIGLTALSIAKTILFFKYLAWTSPTQHSTTRHSGTQSTAYLDAAQHLDAAQQHVFGTRSGSGSGSVERRTDGRWG